MSSKNHSDDLQIERDLPTTKADIVALRQLRHNRSLTFAEALDQLSSFDLFPHESQDRPLPIDWEPFRL